MTTTLTDLKVIQQIVTDYGKILERMAWATSGAPESILPYPKETIKSAILLWLKIEKDEQTKKDLKAGYCHLALFIKDEQAQICVAAQIALESGDPSHSNLHLLEKSNEIQIEISSEMKRFCSEVSKL